MNIDRLIRTRDSSPLLSWAALTGLVAWAAYLLWQTGLLGRLLADDPSRLSQVILIIYAATQAYAGRAAWLLQRDIDSVRRHLADGVADDDRSLLAAWVRARGSAAADTEQLPDLERILGKRLESGWFMADLMFKIGLVGTVIGFIVMLGAITDLKSLDIHQARQMLGDMSSGMRLALYTTLAGLSCGALTGVQFHLLERCAAGAGLALTLRAAR